MIIVLEKIREQTRTSVKVANGEAGTGSDEVRRRWSLYYEELLNVSDDMVVYTGCLGQCGM